jgi:hypothetical protein
MPYIFTPHIFTTDEIIRATFEPYVTALGKVAHAWNHLQETLGQLFCALTGLDERVGLAIWHSSRNDRAQHAMLKAALVTCWHKRLTDDLPTARDDLQWLLKEANNVAELRDNAVHAPMSLVIGRPTLEIVPAAYSGNRRALKLVGKDILAEFAWYEDSADTLTRFARAALAAIVSDDYPWPARPSMPASPPIPAQVRSEGSY